MAPHLPDVPSRYAGLGSCRANRFDRRSAHIRNGLHLHVALLTAAATYPFLLGLAVIAYGFGLRHAVDPDHIAVIDSTTRKLMQEGKRLVGMGFFFSLGHSIVVFALSVLIALSASFVKTNLPQMRSIGGVIGTSVSGVFLVLIAALNLIVLIDIYNTWRAGVKGGTYDDTARDKAVMDRTRALAARPVARAGAPPAVPCPYEAT